MVWILIATHVAALGLGWFGHKKFGAQADAAEAKVEAKAQTLGGVIGSAAGQVKKDL